VTSIANNAFDGCINLKSINVDESNKPYKSIDGVLFDENDTLLEYPEGKDTTTYSIPYGTTSVDENAFRGNTYLIEVIIPSSVSVIGDHAFEGCEKLLNVSMDKGISFIGDYAFNGCKTMKAIVIPSSVVSLGRYALEGCSSLSTVQYLGDSNPCVGSGMKVFDNCDSLQAIYVPPNYYDDYTELCESINICYTDTPGAFDLKSTVCSEEYCFYGNVLSRDRDNVSKWKHRTDACVLYECDDKLGFVQHADCVAEGGVRYMCLNGGCLPRGNVLSVELDLEDFKASQLNVTLVKGELKDISGVDITNVAYELDSNANILRLVIQIDDEPTGHKIVNSVNDYVRKVDPSQGCPDDKIGCRIKHVRLVFEEEELLISEAITIHINEMVAFMVCVLVLFLLL